jgi:hypothetical protein
MQLSFAVSLNTNLVLSLQRRGLDLSIKNFAVEISFEAHLHKWSEL